MGPRCRESKARVLRGGACSFEFGSWGEEGEWVGPLWLTGIPETGFGEEVGGLGGGDVIVGSHS